MSGKIAVNFWEKIQRNFSKHRPTKELPEKVEKFFRDIACHLDYTRQML